MMRLASMWKPSNLLTCPLQMLIATPFRNPTRMGLDKKSAIAPSRKKLAAMQNRPAKNVTVTESDQYNWLSPPASGATAAAIIAHTAASGFTINCREVPKKA
jgi:hypothetical protein